jgi:hypothetical protein
MATKLVTINVASILEKLLFLAYVCPLKLLEVETLPGNLLMNKNRE